MTMHSLACCHGVPFGVCVRPAHLLSVETETCGQDCKQAKLSMTMNAGLTCVRLWSSYQLSSSMLLHSLTKLIAHTQDPSLDESTVMYHSSRSHTT